MSFDKIFHLTAGVYFHFHNIYTQLAKMSFDKIFDLTAGVYFNFYNIYYTNTAVCTFCFCFFRFNTDIVVTILSHKKSSLLTRKCEAFFFSRLKKIRRCRLWNGRAGRNDVARLATFFHLSSLPNVLLDLPKRQLCSRVNKGTGNAPPALRLGLLEARETQSAFCEFMMHDERAWGGNEKYADGESGNCNSTDET